LYLLTSSANPKESTKSQTGIPVSSATARK
jgi:hypothetical protein